MGFDMELLRRNRFCQGIKRGREYQCGSEAGEDAKGKAVELLTEAVRRILRWRVWEAWWVVEAMDEWLTARDRLEVQLRGKYGDDVVNAITGLVDKFINYNEKFLNYWREVGYETRRLIDDLTNGKAEVVIRGEDVSGISVHSEHITLDAHKARGGSITVKLVLNGLEGVTIKVPDVFRKTMSGEEYRRFIRKVLKALRGGIEETDGFVAKGKATMITTQVWQVIVWALLYPGEVRIYIDSINVNNGDVTIKWYMRSSHKPLKGKILSNADRLSEEELLAFAFTAVLGDGSATIERDRYGHDVAVIEIAMSDEKFKAWLPLLERLREIGFKSGKPKYDESRNKVDVRFRSSFAIDLARAMINVLPLILRDVLDALGFDKWVRIRRIAEMEVKFRRGEVQIIVAGYGFTVDIQKGTVELAHWTRDDGVEKVINALKAVYGDGFAVNVHKSGRRLAIAIPMYVFEKYDDIKGQVIEVLRRKLEKTKDERKRQVIIKHLKRLAPTEGAAAANHPSQAQVI